MITRNVYWLAVFAGVFGVAAMASPAHAILLPPGGSTSQAATGESPTVIGALVGTQTVTVTANPSFTATVLENVFANSTTHGITGLLFEYTVTNNGPDSLGSVTISKFTKANSGAKIAVDYDAATGVSGVNAAPDLLQTTGAGGVRFFFDDTGTNPQTSINAGETSYTLYIQTNATLFSSGGNVSLQDNLNGSGPAFSPGPEPSTLVLFSCMGIGLVGGAFWKRRKSQKASA